MSEQTLDQLYQSFMSGIYAPKDDSARFIKSGALSADDQLAVYRGSVLGGLSQALADLFPAIRASVGERFFDAMATKYALKHPSESYSLDHYGDAFPEFVRDFPPLKEFPYLFDLARLEWAWHLCFHSKDPVPFDPQKLGAVSPEQQEKICFELGTSLSLISSDFPLFKLWQMNQPNAELAELDLEEGGAHVVVWREGLRTRIAEISSLEAELFNSIKNMETLGTIFADSLSNWPHEEINAALANFIQYGWIADYRLVD